MIIIDIVKMVDGTDFRSKKQHAERMANTSLPQRQWHRVLDT